MGASPCGNIGILVFECDTEESSRLKVSDVIRSIKHDSIAYISTFLLQAYWCLSHSAYLDNMATKDTPGADGGADVMSALTSQLQATNLNELKIMTMSLKHGSWRNYTKVKISRGTTKMIIESKSPDIIFLQDIPAPESELKKLEILGLKKDEYVYEYTDGKQVGMMWRNNSLGHIGKIITIDCKNVALDAVIGDSVNQHLRDISSRTCIVLLKQISSDNHMLVISWHADSKINKYQEHTLVFHSLLDFALEIAKRIVAKKKSIKGKPLPVVIGGHFNIDLHRFKLESGVIRKEFVLCEYEPTAPREKNDEDIAIHDYFLYSGDVTVEDVRALELNKDSPKFSFTAEETKGMDQDQLYALDYVPILGRLLFQPGGSGAIAGVDTEKQGPTGTGDVTRCQ